jgi:hypothetical protein
MKKSSLRAQKVKRTVYHDMSAVVSAERQV